MALLFEYSLRIFPGLVLITLIFLLFPKNAVLTKIFLLIFDFILMRDAMTPMGLWTFGIDEGTIWLRFIDDGFILIALALTSLVLTVGILYFNKSLRQYILWFGRYKITSLVVGFIGGVVVIIPFYFMYMGTSAEELGGAVSLELLLPLLIFSLFGNFTEEVLFRGYLQGYLETQLSSWHAVLLSGLIFAMGHIFLAVTVTDLGIAVILFTLYEGIICAVVRKNHGVIAATVTHGMTIFILASGLL